MLAWNK